MIIPGLTTVTTRHLSVAETVNIASENGLQGIEWEGIKHVIPGELKAADEARRLCESKQIAIPSYGSYYRVGVSEAAGMPFTSVVETARALGAPAIRIWAGERDYDKSSSDSIESIINETLRIADLAAENGLKLIFEFHGDSLTNTTENAIKFSKRVAHQAVSFSWQPPHAVTQTECEQSLTALLPLLNTLHVFHWDMGDYPGRGYTRERFIEERVHWVRHPLREGTRRWQSYFEIAGATGKDHWALLEFVKDESKQQLKEDAATLKELIGMIQ